MVPHMFVTHDEDHHSARFVGFELVAVGQGDVVIVVALNTGDLAGIRLRVRCNCAHTMLLRAVVPQH